MKNLCGVSRRRCEFCDFVGVEFGTFGKLLVWNYRIVKNSSFVVVLHAKICVEFCQGVVNFVILKVLSLVLLGKLFVRSY